MISTYSIKIILKSSFNKTIVKIPVYFFFRSEGIIENSEFTLALVISALIGVRIGKKWLESMKSESIRKGIMIGIVASGIFYLFEALT